MEEELLLLKLRWLQKIKAGRLVFESLRCIFVILYSLAAPFAGNECFEWKEKVKNVIHFKGRTPLQLFTLSSVFRDE